MAKEAMLTRKVLITSGKGGVGKSCCTVFLGQALARHGFRVLLIELDAGLRGLDLMLGLEDRNPYDMGDILKGRCDPYDAVSACGESRLSLLSAPSGDWSEFSQADLVWLCREIASYYDWILLDAPAGIGRGWRRRTALCWSLRRTPSVSGMPRLSPPSWSGRGEAVFPNG